MLNLNRLPKLGQFGTFLKKIEMTFLKTNLYPRSTGNPNGVDGRYLTMSVEMVNHRPGLGAVVSCPPAESYTGARIGQLYANTEPLVFVCDASAIVTSIKISNTEITHFAELVASCGTGCIFNESLECIGCNTGYHEVGSTVNHS